VDEISGCVLGGAGGNRYAIEVGDSEGFGCEVTAGVFGCGKEREGNEKCALSRKLSSPFFLEYRE
jgi:hypothetical protein